MAPGVLYPGGDLVVPPPKAQPLAFAHTDDQLSAAPMLKLPVSNLPAGSHCEDVLISRTTCSLINFCLDSHQIRKFPL